MFFKPAWLQKYSYGRALSIRVFSSDGHYGLIVEGLRSIKVVSIQVDSTQIEVVSRHYRSRFDTCRKSISFNSIFRPVAGQEAGGLEPLPENFQIWIKFRYKSEILLTKMDSFQWKLQFPSIVDHSKIMYCCSSVQFWIVERNEIVFLLCQIRPTALKYLLIFHQNRQKQNWSKCTNDNPELGLLDFFVF